MVRRGDTATITASDIGEFVFSILTTLDCEGLEGLVPKGGTLPSEDTKRAPFKYKNPLQVGHFGKNPVEESPSQKK